jgi:glucose dehydrogenase
VDLKTGVPAKDAKYSTHQDVDVKGVCPTNMGVKGLNPIAYSPRTNLIYAPLNVTCMRLDVVKSKYAKGNAWVGADIHIYSSEPATIYKKSKGTGGLRAMNPLSGSVTWEKIDSFWTSSGVIATAGNLIFYGTLDRWIKALDAKTGKELWKYQVGSGIVGNSFTYSHKGKQFVGVASGVGGWPYVALQVTDYSACRVTDVLCPVGPFEGVQLRNALPGGGAINIFSL